jgi:hypothetical protein
MFLKSTLHTFSEQMVRHLEKPLETHLKNVLIYLTHGPFPEKVNRVGGIGGTLGMLFHIFLFFQIFLDSTVNRVATSSI